MSIKHAWAAISSLTLSSVAFAQTSGTLTYGPAPVSSAPAVPVPIPSLLLIPLGVLMAVIGYRTLRGPQGRKLLSVMLLGAGLTLSALGSLNIPQALASMLELDNPEGGVINLPIVPAEISNTSGVALKLGTLSIDRSCTSKAPSTTQCESNLILESGESCAVDYDCKKVVFLTSTLQDGSLGGLAGADAICQNRAADAGLQNPDNYKAWLSDSAVSVADRFAQSEYPYVRTDGTVHANDWDDLFNCEVDLSQIVLAPNCPEIEYDEYGEFVPALGTFLNQDSAGNIFTVKVGYWDYTAPNGESEFNTLNCNDWTRPQDFTDAQWDAQDGSIGDFGRARALSVIRASCSAEAPLLCFEQ
ncbi:MAG: midcut-by-XrtH protein [Pseudomonadales bacterium]|nr:midcut-by-XrtH protein [Pseudomonadales bacterium]